jgi:hypothetical protein
MRVVTGHARQGTVIPLVTGRLHEPDGLVPDEDRVVLTDRPRANHLGQSVTTAAKEHFIGRLEASRTKRHREHVARGPAPGGFDMRSAGPVAFFA